MRAVRHDSPLVFNPEIIEQRMIISVPLEQAVVGTYEYPHLDLAADCAGVSLDNFPR